MSVFTYSRTSICQDVAGLVNKVAVFVVLDGGRSWALRLGRRNRYQRRVPRERTQSVSVSTVWCPEIIASTIGPPCFGFKMAPGTEERSRPVDSTIVTRRWLFVCVSSLAATQRRCSRRGRRVVIHCGSERTVGPHPGAVASTDCHTPSSTTTTTTTRAETRVTRGRGRV